MNDTKQVYINGKGFHIEVIKDKGLLKEIQLTEFSKDPDNEYDDEPLETYEFIRK